MRRLRVVVVVVLAAAAGIEVAAGSGVLPVLPLPGIGTLGEGGRQPFGQSDVNDPLRGLGKQPNPLDVPIQGDLDRYRDDLSPVPILPSQPDLTPSSTPRPLMRPFTRLPAAGLDGLGADDIWPQR